MARWDQVSVLHLRYFLAVVEEGTVRAAAARIGIAQPSLSQHLSRLEARLGVRLFDRGTTGMRPTADGRGLALLARSTLDGLAELAGEKSLARKVGTPRGVDDAVLARLGPGEFVQVDSADALRQLRRGAIDAAVVRGPMTVPDGFSATEVHAAPLGVLVADADPLAGGDRVEWSALGGYALLWFDERRAPEYAQWLLGVCRAHGWTPRLDRVDPAGAAVVEHALRTRPGLVALRPKGSVVSHGLNWVELAEAPVERYLLVVRSG